MYDAARRPMGRLFYWLLPIVLLSAGLVAQSPTLTTISDVVFRADGTPAGGTLLISWPEFSTSGGQAVAAGNKSVILGAGGALSACAAGVTGSESQYYVYLSGTGTPEAVLVTGGTCAGNGMAGTLQFTTTTEPPSYGSAWCRVGRISLCPWPARV